MADPKIIDPLDFLGSAKPTDDATKKLFEDLRKLVEAGGISKAFISPHRQTHSSRTSVITTPITEGPLDALKVQVLKSRSGVKGSEIKEQWEDELPKFEPDLYRREFMGEWVDAEPVNMTIPIKIDFTRDGQKGSKTWKEAKARLERRGPPSEAPWLPHTDEEVEHEVRCMELSRSFIASSPRYGSFVKPRGFLLSDL